MWIIHDASIVYPTVARILDGKKVGGTDRVQKKKKRIRFEQKSYMLTHAQEEERGAAAEKEPFLGGRFHLLDPCCTLDENDEFVGL